MVALKSLCQFCVRNGPKLAMCQSLGLTQNPKNLFNELVFSSVQNPRNVNSIVGGSNQIRTGVNGFADRYLTTRTWNLISRQQDLEGLNCDAKLRKVGETAKFSQEKLIFEFSIDQYFIEPVRRVPHCREPRGPHYSRELPGFRYSRAPEETDCNKELRFRDKR